jgi:hypothetical protein
MRKRPKKKQPREDEVQAAVRVVNTIIRKYEGDDSASLTDDPNVIKMEKKQKK